MVDRLVIAAESEDDLTERKCRGESLSLSESQLTRHRGPVHGEVGEGDGQDKTICQGSARLVTSKRRGATGRSLGGSAPQLDLLSATHPQRIYPSIPIPLISPRLGKPTSTFVKTHCHPCSQMFSFQRG